MTRMKRHIISKVIVPFLMLVFLASVVSAATIPYDKTAVVSGVIDGSTISLTSSQMIKLAGIDTPAVGCPGYSESKNYLTMLLPQGATVYLDEDFANTTLCLVYLDYNATHIENINEAMILSAYASPNSTNSQFNPTAWTQFTPKQESSSSPTPLLTAQPTAPPTATPFTPPTPSVNPSMLQPTATITATPIQNTVETPNQNLTLGFVIIAVVAAALFLGLILKRKK